MRALVTGASEGLGRAFAIRLAEEGYLITAVARNEARLTELMDELEGGPHEFLIADLGNQVGIDRCAVQLHRNSYRLLVNNAGHSRFGTYSESEIDDEMQILAVNCKAAMILAHAYLKVAQPGDALINLSSLTYFLPTPIQPTYVATKSFLGSISESLWYQARSRGVYVQGLCPGIMRTQFLERAGLNRFLELMDFLSTPPTKVVDSSLRAMRKRRGPIVIPGFGNKLIAILCRLLPRRWTVVWLGRAGDLAQEELA